MIQLPRVGWVGGGGRGGWGGGGSSPVKTEPPQIGLWLSWTLALGPDVYVHKSST